MQISDILTFFGILLAVYALIGENDRQLIKLRLSYIDIAVLTILFLVINYLVLFNWFYEHGWFLEYLMAPNGFPPDIIAYFVLIIWLVYAIYSLFIKKYSRQKRQPLIDFYEELLAVGNYTLLLNLLKQNHKKAILNKLDGTKSKRRSANQSHFLDSLCAIATHKDLVFHTVNVDPYFYAEIASTWCAENPHYLLQDFIPNFVDALFANQNKQFFKELRKNANDPLSSCQILYSILENRHMVDMYHLWQPAGKRGKYVLSRVADTSFVFNTFDYVEGYEDDFWSLEIGNIIQYFNVMVTNNITAMGTSHQWLMYYATFARLILRDTSRKRNTVDWTKEFPTNILYLVDRLMIWNIRDWLELSYEKNNPNLVGPIVKTYRNIIYDICNSTNIGDPYKIKVVDEFLSKCDLYYYQPIADGPETNQQTVDILRAAYRMQVIAAVKESTNNQFIKILPTAWDAFDKTGYDQGACITAMNTIIEDSLSDS